jgi:hypothetical protein
MVALICAVLCVGLGVTLHAVFGGVFQCFLAGIQGATATSCTLNPAGGGSGGGGGGVFGDSGDSGGGGVPAASPSPTVTPTPTPTPTP